MNENPDVASIGVFLLSNSREHNTKFKNIRSDRHEEDPCDNAVTAVLV